MGDRSGKLSIGTAGSHIAVRGNAHETVPVLEVSQFGSIDFIDNRTVCRHTVPAAPQPVIGFGYEIHLGHLSCHRNGAVCGRLGGHHVQDAHHNDIVFLAGPQHHGSIQCLQGFAFDAGNGHTVILLKSLADAGSTDLHIGGCNIHPHSAGCTVLIQCMRRRGSVDPVVHVGRFLRLRGRNNGIFVFCAVNGTQLEVHISGAGKAGVNIAMLRQIQSVDPLPVRQDNHICAHGNQLLGAVFLCDRKAHIHRIPIDHKVHAIHIAQIVL